MIESLVVAKRKNMATIVTRSGKLCLDYRYRGERIRKSTGLTDTKENRKILKKEVIPALELKMKMGDFVKPEYKKFSYYFSKFLVDHESDKSFHNRIYIYKKVNTKYGNAKISKITRRSVKEYLASLEIKNSTKKDYLNCIKGVLDIALDDDVIDKNVATGITFKREAKEEVAVFNSDEVQLLLDKSDGMLKNFLGISFYTGMRSGEVLGLMHSDIFDTKISIKRSISKGRVTTPKTLRSIRDIPMFESVKPFIEAQKKLSKSLYLFDYNKQFIKDISYFKRRWHKLIEDCNIEYQKIYSTRHTFITAMLNSEKFKLMEISAIVGHTSPQMIMTNYTGFIKDAHLKIDIDVDLFGHKMDTSDKKELKFNC